MTRIEVSGDLLKIEILGWDKLWAFKSRLEFPLDHVISMRRWDQEKDGKWRFRGIRAPGTHLPGVIIAGTYYRKGQHFFYAVHHFEQTIVIELKDDWYLRVLVEVEDPEAVLRLVPSSVRLTTA
jgi:hypothetical protein